MVVIEEEMLVMALDGVQWWNGMSATNRISFGLGGRIIKLSYVIFWILFSEGHSVVLVILQFFQFQNKELYQWFMGNTFLFWKLKKEILRRVSISGAN